MILKPSGLCFVMSFKVKSRSELREEPPGGDGEDVVMVAVFTLPSIVDSCTREPASKVCGGRRSRVGFEPL